MNESEGFGKDTLIRSYDSLHHLTGVQDVNTASGANIAGFSYGYDGANVQNGFRDNRTSQTRAYGSEAAQTISYGYNPTSMLQGEGASQSGASTPALSKSYSFDAMGNRTSFSDAVAKTQITSTYNNLNQLTSTNSFSTTSGTAVGTGSSSCSYDGDGNMALISSKDVTGTTTGETRYSYDDASRLIGIETPGSSKWQFVYDGASRLRISRSWLWQNGQWVQNSEKRRVYLGMDVLQERDSQNNVIASYSGGLAARSTATGTVFYGFDGGGNVTSLTDSTGAVVGSYTYDAWGNIIASSGAKAQENPYRYSGKEQLAGYYSYGFRFYSSGLGRWINRDPLQESGGVNLYAMVDNNPLNCVDSYGLKNGRKDGGDFWWDGPKGRPDLGARGHRPPTITTYPDDSNGLPPQWYNPNWNFGPHEHWDPFSSDRGTPGYTDPFGETWLGPGWAGFGPTVREGIRVHEKCHRGQSTFMWPMDKEREGYQAELDFLEHQLRLKYPKWWTKNPPYDNDANYNDITSRITEVKRLLETWAPGW